MVSLASGVAWIRVATQLGRVGVSGFPPVMTTRPSVSPNAGSRMSVIAPVVPAGTCFAEAFRDVAAGSLFPAERAVVAGAVAKRVAEFATGRACARRALAGLGIPPGPLLPDHSGAPKWPDGIVGSITHCRGYRAAVATRRALAAGIGIDAEPDAPLPDRVLDVISRPGERRFVAGAAEWRPQTAWDRLLFCCKEAVYKAASGVSQDVRRVADVAVRVDIPSRTFTALPVRARAPDARLLSRGTGRWSASAGLLVAAFVLSGGAEMSAAD